MNARDDNGVTHLVTSHPMTHPINPDHVVCEGFTECMLRFTWLTGPRHLPNSMEGRYVPTHAVCTCLRCLWEVDH